MNAMKIKFIYTMMCMFFLFMGGHVGLSASINEVNQQGQTVKGIVKDNTGEPLPGVSIVVKGTTTGVTTDFNGNYTITVPSGNSVLAVSYVGFANQEVTVGNRTEIDITMSEDIQSLDEVVVVGYGVQKKINLTGSVATISSEKLENRAAPSLSTSLAGMATGVSITQGSGKPGSESVSMLIRGVGSFNNSSPMILIDGVSGTMDSVNPDDVESISFLKDAASAAIYGSRAANGVILITTKKGRRNAAPSITYSNVFASQKPVTDVSFLSDMPLWMELHNKAQITNNPATTSLWYQQQTIDDWQAANNNPNGIYTDPVTGNQIPNWLAYPNTDWAQLLFESSFFQKHTLSVSGGSENSSYLLSAGYQNNPGTLENTAQERYNIRINAESKIAGFLRFGTQTFATKNFNDPGSTSLTFLQQAYPGINPKHNGLYGASEDPTMTNMNNVLRTVAATGGKQESTRINTTWYANAEIWKGLTAEAKFNYQNLFANTETYSKNLPAYRFREGTENPVEYIGNLEQASTYRYSYSGNSYTADLMLNYMGTFGDHDVSALLGYEQYYNANSAFSATKQGLIDWSITDITSAAEMKEITSDRGDAKTDYAMISYFGRVNYAFKSRYLFEANFRSDASSKFAPGHRTGVFPSFSAGWRISEESFFEPVKPYVDNLKIRASWGKLGNTTPNGYSSTNKVDYNYLWQALYQSVNNVMGESIYNGLVQSQLSNYLLSWESVKTTNFGFDAMFLNQRLNVEFDVYRRNTTGILTMPPLFLSMGNVSAPFSNTADMKNDGIEFTIGWRDKIKDFHYGISFNAAYNTNKVVNFKGALKWGEIVGSTDVNGNPVNGWVNLSDVSTGGDTRRVEGYMLDEYFLRKPYSGSGKYYNTDGSVDPNGGPKDGMIRTKADLEWVNAMLSAGYTFNGKTVDMPNAAKTTGGRGGYLWYGEMIMADTNGDGNYGNDNDREFIGKSSRPKWTIGSTISAEWKGFDLSMTWSGRIGSYHYINDKGINGTFTQDTDAFPADAKSLFYSYDAVKSVKEYDTYDPATDPDANVNGEYPRLINASLTSPSNTLYLYNSSYLKLKTLQIGYSLPQKWIQAAKISRARIFFSGENLLTLKNSNFLGVDPELGGSIAVYPLARMVSGGLSLTF